MRERRTSRSLAGGSRLEEDTSVSPTLSGSVGVGGGIAVGITGSAPTPCGGEALNNGYLAPHFIKFVLPTEKVLTFEK